MCTARFWNNLHQVRHNVTKLIIKIHIKTYLRARKSKGLNRIAKIGYGHFCLPEGTVSFNNNCLIQELLISIVIYLINKGNNKITELRTILQRESQNSSLYKQTKSVNNRKTVKTVMTLTWYRHF